ncbi:MAG: hypothetical protein WBG32_00880 [Nodosilinea sp.]
MSKSSDRTSYFAVDEECCQRMAVKYEWTLLEARRRIAAHAPLVERIFRGDTAAYEAWKSNQVLTV